MPVGAEQFPLRPLGPVRTNDVSMRPTERQAPTGAGVAARDLDDQPVGGSKLELIPAKQAGLCHPIEPGLQECLVDLRRVGAAFIRFVLLVPQQAPQGDGTFEQALGRHAGFGLRDRRGSCGGRCI